jgi:hypothetical protein
MMKNLDGSPWIKTPDFTETVLLITIRNTTTDFSPKAGELVALEEVSETGLTLRVPAKSCALGHILSITIRRTQRQLQHDGMKEVASQTKQITVTAKVTEVEPLDGRSKSATLQLYQVNQGLWDQFLMLFQEKQKSVDGLVARMKA